MAETGPSIFVLVDTQQCRVERRGLLVRDRCQPLDILQGLRVAVSVVDRDSKHDPETGTRRGVNFAPGESTQVEVVFEAVLTGSGAAGSNRLLMRRFSAWPTPGPP